MRPQVAALAPAPSGSGPCPRPASRENRSGVSLAVVVGVCTGLALGCGRPGSGEGAAAAAPSGPSPDAALEASPSPLAEGRAAIEAGDFARAADLLGRATTEQPRQAEAWYYLGVAQQQQGATEAAQASYQRSLELKPSLLEAAVNLSAIFLDAGQWEPALAAADRGLASAPREPDLLLNRALALSGLGRKPEAAKAFEAAHAASPSNQELTYLFAESLVAAGEADRALPLLTTLAQADSTPILASTARLLGSLKAFEPCIQALDKALGRSQPQTAELLVGRGLCHHGLKHDDAALADFSAAALSDPKLAAAHYYRGMELKKRGQHKAAKEALTRASALAPSGGVGDAARRELATLR